MNGVCSAVGRRNNNTPDDRVWKNRADAGQSGYSFQRKVVQPLLPEIGPPYPPMPKCKPPKPEREPFMDVGERFNLLGDLEKDAFLRCIDPPVVAAEDTQPLRPVGTTDNLRASKAPSKAHTHVGMTDWVRGRRRWFKNDLLPLVTPGRGPEGRYYIPPVMIRNYTEMLDILDAREKGVVRLLEIQKRYAEKVGRLEDEIRALKQNEVAHSDVNSAL